MKITLRIAIAALLCCGAVKAQVPSVTINPGGGTASDNSLKITVTETSVLTEYKGVKQYGEAPALAEKDKGLWAYFMLERRFDPTVGEKTDTLHKTACEISDIQGQGTAADPWKVVKLLSLKNRTNATFNIAVTYTYVAGEPWYRMDYMISGNERAGFNGDYGEYLVHIYHSERTFIQGTECGLGFADQMALSTDDHYQFVHNNHDPTVNLYGRVGIRKSAGACAITAPAGSHFMKVAGGITTYNASYSHLRDTKNTGSIGYKLAEQLTGNPPEITPVGMAVHKALLFYPPNVPDGVYHDRKSFIVGYDEANAGPALADVAYPVSQNMYFMKAKAGLSSATPQGLEGDGDHVITGVSLRLQNAAFNLPQVVHFRITAAGANPAAAGDYSVQYTKMIIPPGVYNDVNLPLDNIIIHGNTLENADKTIRIEILPNCSPHLDFTGILDAQYTIVDDDENKVFVEPAQPSLAEGQQMQVTLRLTGALLGADLPVKVVANPITAKTTDFEPVFSTATPLTLTIPAGQRTATFTFKAVGDRIIEDAETLEITASAVFGPETRTNTTSIEIVDTTGANPDNLIISFTAPAAFEGDNLVVTAGLPTGVTTEKAIVLNNTYSESAPGNTATLGDFRFNGLNQFPASFSIPAEQGSGSFTLEIVAGDLIEPDEFIYFDVADAGNKYTILNPVQLTLKDKVTPGMRGRISFNNPVTEGSSTVITGTVELPRATQVDLPVTVELDPSSTASLSDLELLTSLTVTVPAGQTTATFQFRALADNLLEGEEKLRFTFNYAGMPVDQDGGPLPVTDIDNTPENKQVYLVDASDAYVSEGNEIEVKIRLNPVTGVRAAFPITVNFEADLPSSSVSAGEYAFVPATSVTFAPGEIEKTIRVQAVSDGLTETEELMVLVLTADVTTDFTEQTVLAKNIFINDPGFNDITFTAAGSVTTLHEGAAGVTITAALVNGVAPTDIVITLPSSPDVNLPSTVTMLQGTSSVDFTLAAIDDDVLEKNETYQLSGTAAGYNVVSTPFTITDQTSLDAARKQLTVDVENDPLAEGSATKVWVKLPTGVTTADPLEVNISSGANTTLAAGEFSFADTKVTIPAGGSSGFVMLNTTADNILELTEKLHILAAGTDLLTGSAAEKTIDVTDVTGTIAANKVITITVAPAGATSVNEGGQVTYTFRLPVNVTTAYALDIQALQITGTTTDAGDFVAAIPGLVTIPASGSQGMLQLDAKSDGVMEITEKLRMEFSMSGFTFSGSNIIDLDVIDAVLPAPTIKLSVSAATVDEGQPVTIRATLQGFTSATPITVSLSRGASSGTDATTDHTALSSITIPANTPYGETIITALADQVLEPDEQLIVDGTVSPFQVDGTALIIKDKTGRTLSMIPAATSVQEGADVKLRIKLPDGVVAAGDIAVQVTAAPASGVQPGSADYNISPAVVKIPKDGGEVEITLHAVPDAVIEGDEALVITATATVDSYGPQTVNATITITETNADKIITITAGTEITENGPVEKIRFALPAGVTSTTDITVNLATGGTATSADFEDPLPASVVIPFTTGVYELVLKAKKDLLIEPDESLTLTATAAGYTVQGTASLTVKDADRADAVIVLTPSQPNVGEGNTVMLTAQLQNGMSTLVPIDITVTQDGGTASALDYTGLTDLRIDPANAALATATITLPDDVLLEWTETLIIKGATANIPVTGATINIEDKNTLLPANKQFTLVPDAAAMEEGGSMQVWVRLPNGQHTADALTVTLGAATPGTTLDNSEYQFPATVTIPAGADGAAFTLQANTDNLIEPTEVLKLRATGSVYSTGITHETAISVTDKADNYVITISGDGSVTENGVPAVIRFALPAGITGTSDIVIGLTKSGTADVADFTVIPTTVTIKAGDPFAEISLTAVKEGLIEGTETLLLTPALAGYTFTGTAALNVQDADLSGASIVLSVTPSVVEGEDMTVTATLQGGVTVNNDIDITLTKAGSQAADNDHSAPGVIRINAGATSGTGTITALTDLLLERDETLVLNGVSGAGIAVTGVTAVIRDATARNITITPAAATITENNKVVLKVTLPANVTTTEKIAVNLTKDAGSSVADGEFILPASVEIDVNQGEVAFEVEAVADGVLEADEILNILAGASVLGDAKSATATVTIKDGTNTPANMHITVSGDTQVTEGTTAAIRFRLPAGISTDLPLTIVLTPGAATPAVADADLSSGIPLSVTIPGQGSEGTLTISAVPDGVIEPVEKLFLIPAATGFTFSNNVMLDVLDGPHSGAITFSSDKPQIREGVETATITVSLPGSLVAGGDIRVDVLKGASTAAATDHTALPAFVVIEAGKHEAVFAVSAPADLVLEDMEDLVLQGTAAGFTITGTTLQLEDATSLDPLNKVLQLSPANTTLAEGATGDFVVRLPAGVTSSRDITVQVSKTAASSTAADTDHTQIPVSVVIPATQNASADFDITAVTDGIIEQQEKLRLDGIAPAGFTIQGTDIFISDATGLNPANLQITLLPDSIVLHEGSTCKVIITLPAGITSSTDIPVNIMPDATLTAGVSDYSIVPATIVIPKDNNRVQVVLEVLQDGLAEPLEQLKLTGTAAGYTMVPSHTITIPGDPAPAVTAILQKTADAAEPAVDGGFIVQLNAAAPSDVTVQYTIGGTAVAGEDYIALSGQVVVKAGETSASIAVQVKDDAVVEGAEHITLTLQSAAFTWFGTPQSGMVNNSPVTIQLADNDEASLIIEKVADATEPATPGSVRIRFTNPQATAVVPVSVQYAVSGTATAGADYVALPGAISIPAGSNEAVVAIQPNDDLLLEGTETISITLTGAAAALPGYSWPVAEPSAVTVNLYDNDVVRMEIFGSNQAAEGGVVPVTLRASEAVGADITVSIQLQHDAARTVTATVPRNNDVLTVIMPANQTEVTFNITIDENDVNDDNGYVNLVIQPFSGSGQPYGKGASGNTATVVTDNDPLQISFRQDTARLKEGNTGLAMMPFAVQLSRMSSRAIQVQYAFADAFEGAGADKDPQRARPGTDFQAGTTSITIPPMQTSAEIAVPITGDQEPEADRYFAIRLTNVTVAGGVNTPVLGTQRTAIGVIENDDQDVDLEVRPHKAISPNGDGKNDVWIIANIEKYSRNEVVIVNRWGGTIFKTNDYNNTSNNFSGTANIGSGTGRELPDGSYFYILQVWGSDGKAARYNGYIVIKRGL